MSSDNHVIVRFVKPSVDSETSTVLQEAFEAVQGIQAESVWFTEDECFSISTKEKRFIYIFEDFKGAAFEHIVNTGNRIYGPVCVLHCLKKATALPKVAHPVFSLTMQGLIVSCTSLEKEAREQIHKYVQWMSGEVSKDFHQNVTHLVAGEVGSKKYIFAAKLKKKIMSPEWVEQAWQAARSSFVRGDDPAYDKYRCPLFKGFVITVSGLESNERGKIKDIVTKQGGKYSGEMKINECTHLIVNMPRGQKYEFAKQWKIHIVSPKWLYDSLDIGYCLEESNYPVGPKSLQESDRKGLATSTPTSMQNKSSEMPDISTISMSHINETNMTMMSNMSTCSVKNHSMNSINQSELRPNYADLLESVDVTKPKNNMFLDGCKLFLTGFKGPVLEKLRKIINIGGGTRLNQITEHVSHVVMGEKVESHIKELEQNSFRPYIVSVDWMVACYHAGETVSEEDYCCLALSPADVTTPKAKSKKPASRKQSVSHVEGNQSKLAAAPEGTGDMQELLSQYLPENASTATMGESTLMRAAEIGEEVANQERVPPVTANQNETLTNQPANQNDSDADTQDMETVDPDATIDEGEQQLFGGRQFVILGFDATSEQEMALLIRQYKGTVLPVTTRRVPDYAVVPVFGCSVTMTTTDIVTNAWLQMCIEQEQLLPIDSDPIFQPITVKSGSAPLKGCVLSVSGYIGTERDVIVHMAAVLGAVVQDYFVKKANAAKKLAASTHLVVNQAEGSKYNAAKKWKIPAVTKYWVVECAKQNKRLDESLFSVDLPQSQNTTLSDNRVRRQRPNTGAGCGVSGGLSRERQTDVEVNEDDTSPRQNVSKEIEKDNGRRPGMECHDKMDVTDSRIHLDTKMPKRGESEKENSTSPGRQPAALTGLADHGKSAASAERRLCNRLESPSSTPNQRKESSYSTPSHVNNRVRELVAEVKCSPVNRKPPASSKSDSPQTDKSFHAKFDLTEAFAELKSPATPRTPNGTKQTKKKSLSLEEVFSYNLELAVKNQSDTKRSFVNECTPFSQRVRSALVEEQEEPLGPLHGVVIAVSKKLSAQQSEYNNKAAKLGADYRWTYDSSCTHFIFQGRLNDANKEFRLAKDQGKIIVSPYWLIMCEEQNCRVDETLFPHTYNPKLSLAVTPAKSTRRSRRARASTKSTGSESSPTQVATEVPTEAPSAVKGSDKTTFTCLDTTQSDEEMAQVAENIEDEERETNTQALVKDLKTLMAATRTYSRGKRINRRADSFSKAPSQDSCGSADRKKLSFGSKPDGLSPFTEKREARPSRLRNTRSKPETQSEASQMIEVSWDDPAAREQQEKLALDLGKHSESVGEHSSLEENRDSINAHDETVLANIPEVTSDVPLQEIHPEVSHQNTSLPPAAEHVKENAVVEKKTNSTVPYILMSGMGQQEREQYGALVEQLGGIILDSAQYNNKCSHLIVGNPARNEKFLSSIAAGKWVLYKSYFDACQEAGTFVEEEPHEWGSAHTAAILEKSTAQVTKLAQAAHRWRKWLHKEGNQLKGAFDGWKVMLLTDKKKEDGFRRLLEAGGGCVVTVKYPCSGLTDVTHAFIDVNKTKYKIDLQELVSAGIHCLKPEYIAAYLMDDPAPDPKVYYIQDVLEMTMQISDIKKRKASGVEPQNATPTKRTRR